MSIVLIFPFVLFVSSWQAYKPPRHKDAKVRFKKGKGAHPRILNSFSSCSSCLRGKLISHQGAKTLRLDSRKGRVAMSIV